jgi:hypothetical protein
VAIAGIFFKFVFDYQMSEDSNETSHGKTMFSEKAVKDRKTKVEIPKIFEQLFSLSLGTSVYNLENRVRRLVIQNNSWCCCVA